ncbi:flagellar hook-associated protein FlgK [Henriciella litoralis]|uniref:flagellar hook-associated protein FlgK n=1 Tax=Henriciella litoralis TaxID=568102 RepID=UPI000A00C178|nr:flagellar hook-associated protein FlgK [Henriciella litoralis]
MSLSNAINVARTGLQASGLRADIVATNVANASTPGYVRRSVLLSESVAGGSTTGVGSDGIARSNDAALTAQRQGLTSDLAQASLIASTWQSLSARLGDTVDGTGLFNLMSGFESALSAAAASPESSVNANGVIDAAKAIVNEFRGLSQYITSERAEADLEIASGVETVNAALKQIEALNAKIASTDKSSSKAAALFDERQRVVDTISEYLPVETIERQNGAVDVMTKEGVFLVSGSARQIEFSASNTFGPSATLENGQLSGLSVDGLDLTPGASAYSAISSGLFGALFTLRDNELPNFSDQLDTVAADLVSRLSADDVDPTKPAGGFGLFVDPAPTAGAGLAGRISINAAVDPAQNGSLSRLRDGLGASTPGAVGNNSILSAMLNAVTDARSINSEGLQGSFSIAELTAALASRAGQNRVGSESILASTSAQHAIASEAEQSQTGVDVDQQMQDLLLIEQAYAANARVIEIANQMLQRLMEI